MVADPLSIPPLPGPARNIHYPQVPVGRLKNGLTVGVVQDARLPRVTVRLGLPAGRSSNPSQNRARLPLAVEMIQEGTSKRSSQQIAEELDRIAARLSSEIFMEYTLFGLSVLEEHLHTALEIFSDLLLHPSFPEEELAKLKSRWKSTVISQRAQAGFLARERTFLTFYEGHPYSRVSLKTEEIDSVDREQLRQAWRHCFNPSGAMLIVCGPPGLDEAVELGDRYLGGWKQQGRASTVIPQVPALRGRPVRIVHRPHSTQSRVLVAGRTPARRDPGLLGFRLANQVFGGGSNSRIFLNLREQKGYTYGAYSVLRTYRHDGLFMASAGVNTDVSRGAIDEILHELREVRIRPPSEEELSVARWEIIGQFVRQMETPGGIGALEMNRRLHDLPADYYSAMIPRLEEITADQVREISSRYFDPQNVVITAVGDRDAIEPQLADLGAVEVYDTQGELMSGLNG